MYDINTPKLPDAMRVLAVSDGRGDVDRIEAVVERAIDGGVRAFQLREPSLTALALARLCERLRPSIAAASGILLVNDRADLAFAGIADGVHLGRRSLPPAIVRERLRRPALVGLSAHDAEELGRAGAAGCDYATLSPVYATSCKPGADVLGPVFASELTVRARLPVLWLGGIAPGRLEDVRASAAFGVAVRSALFEADDVEGVARRLTALVRC